ncbi:MAG: hypoxanthine phosphoribosyltransferase [Bdellovibrionaceae bacterium]|nr:hypoxanthine phosphoribosyltransferase [Pseudobdellovibrionaceae bacterium]
MGRLKDSMIAYLTREEISEITARLGKEIAMDYRGKEVILICPLKGSFVFLADLCRQIPLPQQIDFVHLAAAEKFGTVRILKDISVNIAGKHVLIVEEVIDTGRTLTFLKNRLNASAPASLKVVTLLDKPARREIPLKPDYSGITIDDRYLVGYGMDSDELGRNYSDIFYFKQ